MTRLNKFKYYLKEASGVLSTQVFTLEEIEAGRVAIVLTEIGMKDHYRNPEIVARAEWTTIGDIFEYDVVEYLGKRWEIKWSIVLARFILAPYTMEHNYDFNDKVAEKCKVIGSSITNPELLRQDK